MQLLFLFLFGGVVSFILYLSYDKHISDKKKVNNPEDELKIELNKYGDLTETNMQPNEEIFEKVESGNIDEVNNEEVVRFQARRNIKKTEVDEEEII